MSRDRSDDRDPPAGPHRPRSDNTLLIVALAVGGLFLAGCAGAAALFVFGYRQAAREVERVEQEAEKARRVMSREAFKKLVGMTSEEVERAVGKPDSTTDLGDGGSVWVYSDAAADPATGRAGSAEVRFDGGRVTEVAFP